jgi:predicted acyl esterase
LIGCPKATLWISIDTPDTDVLLELTEIQPDGTSIPLWRDVRRLRYRDSLSQEKLVKPGEIVRCDFARDCSSGACCRKGVASGSS